MLIAATPETERGSAAVLAVCGHSGAGKTTLLEAVIPALVRRGLRVAVVKHCGHQPTIDRPGSDSARLFSAGANVALHAQTETVWRAHGEAEEIHLLVAQLAATHDVILLEGFKADPFPRVWLARREEADPPGVVDDALAVLPWNSRRPLAVLELIEQQLRDAVARRQMLAGILVGGDKTRKGQPASLLAPGEMTSIEHVVAVVRPHTERTFLLGSYPHLPVTNGLATIPDLPALQGPIAGMLAAMRWQPHACWLFVAGDLPQLDDAAIDWLLDQRAPGRWAVIPRTASGRTEPLLALYEPQARGLLEKHVVRGTLPPRCLADEPSVFTPSVPVELRSAWLSVNTPGEGQALCREGAARPSA